MKDVKNVELYEPTKNKDHNSRHYKLKSRGDEWGKNKILYNYILVFDDHIIMPKNDSIEFIILVILVLIQTIDKLLFSTILYSNRIYNYDEWK